MVGPKENNGGGNKKKLESTAAEEVKRPGSAVSREFQPNRQQKAGTFWRKQQEEQPQQKQHQQIYGFVPFKSAGQTNQKHQQQQQKQQQGVSIYGTAIRPSNPTTAPHQLHPLAADYLHSIYAPPQIVRQQQQQKQQQQQSNRTASMEHSAAGMNGAIRGPTAQIQHPGGPMDMMMAQQHQFGMPSGVGSRPGSDLGMYKVMSSRCQSYTTLPRPEHAGEMFEEIVPFSTSQPAQIIYGNAGGGGGMVPPLPGAQFRPSSAASRSLGRKNSTALPVAPLPPAYFGRPTIFDRHLGTEFDGNEYGEGGQLKEIVPWSTISLSSWLTIVFGAAIFCLGVVRLYWRADYAKGQEIFYGISAICNGLVGFFASQNRSFCMFVGAFLLCAMNTVFIFVPFLSGILPLVPLLSSASNGKPYIISLGGTKEPVEVDIGLAVLSLMQLAAAFSLLLYGCRAFGTTMKHVEQMRMAAAYHQNGTSAKSDAAIGGGDKN